jgi:hypothetical protein
MENAMVPNETMNIERFSADGFCPSDMLALMPLVDDYGAQELREDGFPFPFFVFDDEEDDDVDEDDNFDDMEDDFDDDFDDDGFDDDADDDYEDEDDDDYDYEEDVDYDDFDE